jgi:hypothetical protein
MTHGDIAAWHGKRYRRSAREQRKSIASSGTAPSQPRALCRKSSRTHRGCNVYVLVKQWIFL